MKLFKRNIIFIVIGVFIIGIIVLFVIRASLIRKEEERAQLADVKYLSALITKSLDFDDASNEQAYLDAMTEGSSIYNTFDRWKGIDKKQKQQAYFIQEDVKNSINDCREDNCAYIDEFISLQRAIETRIKSFDQENVQESNELAGLSNEMNAKNFWHIINNLSVSKLKTIGDNKINQLLDRYYDTAVISYVSQKNWCDGLGAEYHEFARYKSNCNVDFDKAILNISTLAEDKDFSDPLFISLLSACKIEYKIKDIPESADTRCPHIADRNKILISEADNYVNGLAKNIETPINEPAVDIIFPAVQKSENFQSPPPQVTNKRQECEIRDQHFYYDPQSDSCICETGFTEINGRCRN